MDFELSESAKAIEEQLVRFMDKFIYPAEAVFAQQHAESSDPHAEPKVMR